MPKITEKAKSLEEIDESIERGRLVPTENKKKRNKKEEEKKENWGFLFILSAIFFFILGILIICLMNYCIYGTFGL